ncbi:hypothetical protein [Atopobium sp. oral taxon 416]|uniref:hypothetical protein n=1 Tax=Atopobium sp. oral taxon 416 TaxID=712157 RepID=UPI001BAA2DBB|nr:hypothetical protein [Atopobium sp. oral taxon 416]QUC02487.1 hypothetical protein J4859_10585 [Atopobium sp. oral taxon 416]
MTGAEIGKAKRFGSAAPIVRYAGLHSGVGESDKFAAVHHEARLPIPQVGTVARREPGLAIRPDALGLLAQEAGAGQAAQDRCDL